jgi:hypothetical protein
MTRYPQDIFHNGESSIAPRNAGQRAKPIRLFEIDGSLISNGYWLLSL